MASAAMTGAGIQMNAPPKPVRKRPTPRTAAPGAVAAMMSPEVVKTKPTRMTTSNLIRDV